MRVAPSVQAVACGAGAWRSVQLALYALSAFVLSSWTGSLLWQGEQAVVLGSLGVATLASALASLGLSRMPRQLAWDGTQWAVGSPAGSRPLGSVMPMLDLGGWMLVRCVPNPPSVGDWRSQWLALSARDNAAVWPQLRVALHAWRAPQGVASGPLPRA